MDGDLILAIVVVTALAFDFTNGFHDTANVIATTVSTRAMSPRAAVLMAAVLNFVGAFISLQVAATVAGGIVDAGAITHDGRVRRAHRRDRLEPRAPGGPGCRRAPRTRSSAAWRAPRSSPRAVGA